MKTCINDLANKVSSNNNSDINKPLSYSAITQKRQINCLKILPVIQIIVTHYLK